MSNLHLLKPDANPEIADYLRAVADRVDQGDITDLFIVFNDREGQHYERRGFWGDKWRLIGAIEYAKDGVMKD